MAAKPTALADMEGLRQKCACPKAEDGWRRLLRPLGKLRTQRKVAYVIVTFALFAPLPAYLLARLYFSLAGGPAQIAHLALQLLFTVTYAGGMEYYARVAHRDVWHNPKWLWSVHKTHHTTRTGLFEYNDIFALVNAPPAIALLAIAWFSPVQSVGNDFMFGIGCGVSVYGTAYMVVHDGLHHGRFWVGPLRGWAALDRVAAAHSHHHGKEMGPPYGMFLGPTEWAADQAGKPPPPMSWLLAVSLAVCTALGAAALCTGL